MGALPFLHDPYVIRKRMVDNLDPNGQSLTHEETLEYHGTGGAFIQDLELQAESLERVDEGQESSITSTSSFGRIVDVVTSLGAGSLDADDGWRDDKREAKHQSSRASSCGVRAIRTSIHGHLMVTTRRK
jgi:hypothetical protein